MCSRTMELSIAISVTKVLLKQAFTSQCPVSACWLFFKKVHSNQCNKSHTPGDSIWMTVLQTSKLYRISVLILTLEFQLCTKQWRDWTLRREFMKTHRPPFAVLLMHQGVTLYINQSDKWRCRHRGQSNWPVATKNMRAVVLGNSSHGDGTSWRPNDVVKEKRTKLDATRWTKKTQFRYFQKWNLNLSYIRAVVEST